MRLVPTMVFCLLIGSGAGSVARAGQTPKQAYRKTKADLKKLWAAEKNLIQAGIDFHSKMLVGLRKAG